MFREALSECALKHLCHGIGAMQVELTMLFVGQFKQCVNFQTTSHVRSIMEEVQAK